MYIFLKNKWQHLVLIICSVLLLTSCSSTDNDEQKTDEPALSTEAEKLFSGVKTKLSPVEQNKVAALTGLKYDAASDKFSSEGEEVEVQILPVDLNKDKTEEMFVITYSIFLYGNTGQGFDLLMKNEAGNYKSVLSLPGIPGLVYDNTSAMPAIQVGGPGFDFPVYVWKNNKYELAKEYKLTNKVEEAGEASKAYTETIK